MEFTNLLDAKNRHELREWLLPASVISPSRSILRQRSLFNSDHKLPFLRGASLWAVTPLSIFFVVLSSNIRSSGCGPTALAIVISTLTPIRQIPGIRLNGSRTVQIPRPGPAPRVSNGQTRGRNPGLLCLMGEVISGRPGAGLRSNGQIPILRHPGQHNIMPAAPRNRILRADHHRHFPDGMGDLYFVWKRFCVERGRWWKMTPHSHFPFPHSL